jgi:hypothetical protein
MENLPDRPAAPEPDPAERVEFSLLHFRRTGRVPGAARESRVWRAIKWMTGPLIGAILSRWLSGHFP